MARPRTPTALKLLKGTDRPCRTKDEPTPRRAIPSAPEHLSERARLAWGYVAALLDRMQVLTEADALVLEGLCETYAELCAARAALKDRGKSTSYECQTQNGTIWRQYPEVAQIADLDRRFCAWLTKVGLTPADRSKVSAIGDKDEKDPWQAL